MLTRHGEFLVQRLWGYNGGVSKLSLTISMRWKISLLIFGTLRNHLFTGFVNLCWGPLHRLTFCSFEKKQISRFNKGSSGRFCIVKVNFAWWISRVWSQLDWISSELWNGTSWGQQPQKLPRGKKPSCAEVKWRHDMQYGLIHSAVPHWMKLNESPRNLGNQLAWPRPLFMTIDLCYKTITRQGPSWIPLVLLPFGLSCRKFQQSNLKVILDLYPASCF